MINILNSLFIMACSSTKVRLIVLVVNINNYTIQLGAPPYAHQFNGFITPKNEKMFFITTIMIMKKRT